MSYILKNTSALINTRLTDVGRRALSQGNFNISYFQIGDSEVNYTAVPNYSQTNNNILMPAFNAQNDTGVPNSNKQHIKYPYYLSGNQGITYGIPFMDSNVQEVYNAAGVKGFFNETGDRIQSSSAYTVTSNYWVDLSTLYGETEMVIVEDPSSCSPTTGTPAIGDIVTLVIDGNGSCETFGNYAFLTYKIQDMSPLTGEPGTTFSLILDRKVPNYSNYQPGLLYGRVYIYPSGMTVQYDSVTPEPYWQTDTLNFESPCDVTNRENTLIWNMNIVWSESPAGVFSSQYEDYTQYNSISYIGSKEYFGYQEVTGQTDTSKVFYYNSLNEQVVVTPKNQKAIGIIHYTNQSIDNVYGEKFSTIPFDPQNPTDQIGLARHFKLSIPNLLWHKSNTGTIGQTFWIDPPGYDLCIPYYIKSTKNVDMNDPGIRYYHLWDTNPNENGNLNRIGKVFPDQEIVVIDDDEVLAALSYKSNRNWTLPAPKLSLIPPNICLQPEVPSEGILTNDNQVMWLTYRFDTIIGVQSSLHCNYYSRIVGPSTGCTDTSQNVAINFGPEFTFLDINEELLDGFRATSIRMIFQIVNGNSRPEPNNWREVDLTSQLNLTTPFISGDKIVETTFIINQEIIDNSITYELQRYIDIPENGETEILNFGDEYYFYGNIETDISATIYEMKYVINLGNNQFTNTSNPTWFSGTTSYVSEIGLYNSEKDLMVISKLQSPVLRQGIQQYVVKLDF
jgi:hypothetical protein